MTDIQQWIAAILTEHSMAEFSWGADPDCCLCGHNEETENQQGWANHAAAVLVTELGLHEEHNGRQPWVYRYVTEWKIAPQGPLK
jgi:hypothetical protein